MITNYYNVFKYFTLHTMYVSRLRNNLINILPLNIKYL